MYACKEIRGILVAELAYTTDMGLGVAVAVKEVIVPSTAHT